MTSILAVDSRASDREILVTLFVHAGYEVQQASSGEEALRIAKIWRPDLIIADVMMPVMDGADFADHVHDDVMIAQTPIIFCAEANYLKEARVLAQSCRAIAVLVKPVEPQDILDAVGIALGSRSVAAALPEAVLVAPGLLGARLPEYLRDLTGLQRCLRRTLDQSIENSESRRIAATHADAIEYSFQSLSLRLATLLELDIALSAERDPQGMLKLFCQAAQGILNCKYVAMGILEAGGERLKEVAAWGLDAPTQAQLRSIATADGVLAAVVASGKVHRQCDEAGGPTTLGLPDFHPPVSSLLVVPVPTRVATSHRGWVYFADKFGSERFDEEDEKFAVTLAGQLALAYGNLALYEEIRQHAAELEVEVAERRSMQAELAHRAAHDQTTGLPRFVLIEEHLSSAIADAAAHAGRVILLYVDIDRFHMVNETRGRAVGDEVLRMVADRLIALCGDKGYVAHAAADEFAVVLVDEHGAQDQTEFAEAVRADIERIFYHGQQRIYLTCSIGVSCFPDNGSTPRELLCQSEAAMLRAKHDGRNTISAFSNEQKQALEDRSTLGLRLSDAVRNDELVVHYQPQVNGGNGRVLGFEALVRWQSPEFGLLPPMRFLPVAEDLGLIVDVGNFVLESVCQQARDWIDAGESNFLISINVSALQLDRPDFADTVRAALEKSGLPARYIELELTESMVVQNVERAISVMRSLKVLGVQLALDDFGTGYCSLNYLRRFPIDKLKIDQCFVREIGLDAGSAGICRAIITLGHQLGMSVLAEGVETEEQVAYLLCNECDQFQGFYFSRPTMAAQAFKLLRHCYAMDAPPQHRESQVSSSSGFA
ncbi:MAG: EAL domain-containing protein [Dokdonella sp.]